MTTAALEITPGLRHARSSLLFSYVAQGAVFALLVTRIPGIQTQYGISDGLLPVFLAAVPILAGVGSISMEFVVKKTSPRAVLRVVQPLVCLTLLGVGLGDRMWEAAVALAAFGLTVGGLDASQAMSAVALQHRYGRSIMQTFYAAFSLGGIIGASLAWAQVHFKLSLLSMFGTVGVLVAASVLVAGRWYAGPAELGRAVEEAAEAANRSIPWKPLLPLCLAMCVAYIGDATVSNWAAKYLQEGLHSSEQMTTVPYNAYMVVMLIGRLLGDARVQSWGSVRTVRLGAAVCAAGFLLVAVSPSSWIAVAAFAVVGLGISVIVPQVFAAGGRLFPRDSDAAVARLNIFNYVGFLVGAPLVGGLAGATGYRVAMLVPMVLILTVFTVSKAFGPSVVREPEADTVAV
ncbi:MFS transporter [Streptacidiphilus neutrinimicus]|uniref:MFS transporter n=1 Tax=Streptacidiphilus neutrinimicus TaxID=105420 RepID=UPI0005AA5615|nr:MFS transporter [Streptacidiphilus neutrinimicus]